MCQIASHHNRLAHPWGEAERQYSLRIVAARAPESRRRGVLHARVVQADTPSVAVEVAVEPLVELPQAAWFATIAFRQEYDGVFLRPRRLRRHFAEQPLDGVALVWPQAAGRRHGGQPAAELWVVPLTVAMLQQRHGRG